MINVAGRAQTVYSGGSEKDTSESDPESGLERESFQEEFIEGAATSEDISIENEREIDEGDLDAEKERRAKYRQYKLPILEYLNDPIEIKNPQSEELLKEKANQLIHALETFGVFGKVVRISPGPIITLFEIEPAENHAPSCAHRRLEFPLRSTPCRRAGSESATPTRTTTTTPGWAAPRLQELHRESSEC